MDPISSFRNLFVPQQVGEMESEMSKQGYVYIMTSNNNRVLYVGATSDLVRRVWQHKNHCFKGSFTDRYNCEKLVYFEEGSIEEAIEAERRFKNQSRAFKEGLINRNNPEWNDLSMLWNSSDAGSARHPENREAVAQDLSPRAFGGDPEQRVRRSQDDEGRTGEGRGRDAHGRDAHG